MNKVYFLFVILLLQTICFVGTSQTISTFSTSDISNWTLEGDGSLAHSSTVGNPAGSLFFNDLANGLIGIVTLPSSYLGGWEENGEFSFDLFIETQDPDVIEDFPFVVEISGPGGSAIALPNYLPLLNEWQTIDIQTEESSWIIQNGNWQSLITNVNQVRIRMEYISGIEDVFLDNVSLSFDPIRYELAETVCSDFDSFGFDGWIFTNVANLEYEEENGNPDGHVILSDQSGAISKGIAPINYLGDWSVFGAEAFLNFDVKVTAIGGGPYLSKLYHARISGPGGAAIFPVDFSETPLANENWYTFNLPIDENEWQLEGGNWNELMENVIELSLDLEYISGSETVLLDNICLFTDNALCGPAVLAGDFNGDCLVSSGDLLIFLSVYPCSENCGYPDINEDGVVNSTDLLEFLSLYGSFI